MFLSLKGGKKEYNHRKYKCHKNMLLIRQPREYPTGSCWLCPFLNPCLPQGRYQNMFVFYNPATVSAKPVDSYSVSLRFLRLCSNLASGLRDSPLRVCQRCLTWNGVALPCHLNHTKKHTKAQWELAQRDAGKQECSQTGQPSACHCLTQHRYNQEH